MCCMEEDEIHGWYRLLILLSNWGPVYSQLCARPTWMTGKPFRNPLMCVSTFRKGKGQGHALVDRAICHSQGVHLASFVLVVKAETRWLDIIFDPCWPWELLNLHSKMILYQIYCQCKYKAKSYHHIFIYLVASLKDWCARLETNSTVPGHSHHDEWKESQRLEPLQWKLCWWNDIRRLFRGEVGQSTLFSGQHLVATYICATKIRLTLLPSLAPQKPKRLNMWEQCFFQLSTTKS